MLGWVALLSTALALTLALGKGRRRATADAEAFRFPTANSHVVVPWDDLQSIVALSAELEVTEADMRTAMTTVGNSENAIRSYFARPA